MASIPGPIVCATRRVAGKTCQGVSNQYDMCVRNPGPEGSVFSVLFGLLVKGESQCQHTRVPPHPNLKAASCAKSSPNPSIIPLIKGRSRLMAAPLRSDQTVGGW